MGSVQSEIISFNVKFITFILKLIVENVEKYNPN